MDLIPACSKTAGNGVSDPRRKRGYGKPLAIKVQSLLTNPFQLNIQNNLPNCFPMYIAVKSENLIPFSRVRKDSEI
jgi:hypothetical protein